MSPNNTQNPYANAAGTYGNHAQKHETDQRELEARILLKSANFLKDLQGDWDNLTMDVLEETLKYNRKIWLMFYDTALENPEGDRPNDLRSNIVNLANFIFKRENEILASPEKNKLDILININREIAAGLMNKHAAETGAPQQSQAADQNSSQTKKEEPKSPPSSSGGTSRLA